MNAVLALYTLEDLTFNYLSFGFFAVVNSVWTWVAVITAVKTSSSSQVKRVSSHDLASNESSFEALGNNIEEGTKGKLTVYFKQDEGGECSGDGEGRDQVKEDDVVELSMEWFENWERLLKMRKGETGWYSNQDMKLIDGNVVRLWDGSTRRRNAEIITFSVGIITSTW
ncbi:unnamed protein product [Withania somnifera]